MFLFLLFLLKIFTYDDQVQTRNTLYIKQGPVSLQINKLENYEGHAGENFEFLEEYKAVYYGFNLIFSVPKTRVHVDDQSNRVRIVIKDNTEHFNKLSTFDCYVKGGHVVDVSVDGVRRYGMAHTIVAIKVEPCFGDDSSVANSDMLVNS